MDGFRRVKTINHARPGEVYSPSYFFKAVGWKSGHQVSNTNDKYPTPEAARAQAKKMFEQTILSNHRIKVTEKSFHVIAQKKTILDDPFGDY